MKKRLLIVLGIFLAVSALTACGHKSSDEGPLVTTPTPTTAAPTSGQIKLSATGAVAIGALDMMVNLPAGVTVDADPSTREAAAGVVTASGVAAGANTLADAKLIDATATTPAQLHVVVISPNGFSAGECVTIKFKVETNGTFPADKSAFSVTVTSAVAADNNTTPLTGVSAGPLSMSADT